jgi:site-specific recombinase XerD
MTEKAISPLRRRLIEDMAIRRLSPKTQLHYIRHVKRFADFLGRSADKASTEDVHRYQLWLASIGTTVPTVNVSATALRFFFRVTLKRHDLAQELVSTREPRRLPVVLSPEEVGRLLASARNIKHKALLSLAYATGLRASEVVSLKLTDIDRDRMVIRVEQGKQEGSVCHSLAQPSRDIARMVARRAQEGMDVSRSALVVSRLPRPAYECAPAPPDRSPGGGACRHYQTCRRSHAAALSTLPVYVGYFASRPCFPGNCLQSVAT